MNLRRTIETIRKIELEITSECNATIQRLQGVCKHPKCVEGVAEISGGFGNRPPFRVCQECGYAEEGGACGYSLLSDRFVSVSRVLIRSVAQTFVVGGIVPNDVHFQKRSKQKLTWNPK